MTEKTTEKETDVGFDFACFLDGIKFYVDEVRRV